MTIRPETLEWWPVGAALLWIVDRDVHRVAQVLGNNAILAELLQKVENAQILDLKNAMQSGVVSARGIRASGYPVVLGPEEPIPPGVWALKCNLEYQGGEINAEFYLANFGYLAVRVCAADIMQLWPATRYVKRGRRPKFNWKAFETKALAILDYEGAPEAGSSDWNMSQFQKRMAAWCLEEWRQEPSSSTLQTYCRKAVAKYVTEKSKR
jgi:hypothetical protein